MIRTCPLHSKNTRNLESVKLKIFKFKKSLKILKSQQQSFENPLSHANEIYAHDFIYI